MSCEKGKGEKMADVKLVSNLERLKELEAKWLRPFECLRHDDKKAIVFEALPQMEYEEGTFNLIASPASRGKSTLMATMAADLLKRCDAPPVVFLALQEGGRDACFRILEAMVYQKARAEGKLKQLDTTDGRKDNEIAKAARGEGNKYLVDALKEARDAVKAAESRDGWILLDANKVCDMDGLRKLLSVFPDTIVFIDATYELRDEKGIIAFKEWGIERQIASSLAEIADARGQTIIASSYLDTEKDMYKDTPDTLCSDGWGQWGLFAHSVIGLGVNDYYTRERKRIPNQQAPAFDKGSACFFWKMLKNKRCSESYNKSFFFDTRNGALAWSCLTGTESSAEVLSDIYKPKPMKGGWDGWDGADCIHLHACRRLTKIARGLGVQLARGCGSGCSAYESAPTAPFDP